MSTILAGIHKCNYNMNNNITVLCSAECAINLKLNWHICTPVSLLYCHGAGTEILPLVKMEKVAGKKKKRILISKFSLQLFWKALLMTKCLPKNQGKLSPLRPGKFCQVYVWCHYLDKVTSDLLETKLCPHLLMLTCFHLAPAFSTFFHLKLKFLMPKWKTMGISGSSLQ